MPCLLPKWIYQHVQAFLLLAADLILTQNYITLNQSGRKWEAWMVSVKDS